MPGIVGNGVSLEGYTAQEFLYPFLISGTAGVSPPIGSPLMIDNAADNTVKQVTDNATIIGALHSYENRVQEGITVCTLKRKGTMVFDYTGSAPTRGQGVVGSATANKVKAAGAAVVGNIVVAVNTVALTCTVMFD